MPSHPLLGVFDEAPLLSPMAVGVAPQEEDPVQARPGSLILTGHVAQPARVEACTQRPQRHSGAKGAVDALWVWFPWKLDYL
jgi:hypothetical protein